MWRFFSIFALGPVFLFGTLAPDEDCADLPLPELRAAIAREECPAPEEPNPENPGPVDPDPDDPGPVDPDPDDPGPVDPDPDDPGPDDPGPDDPSPEEPDKPKPDKPKPDKPSPNKPSPDKPRPNKPRPDKLQTDKPAPLPADSFVLAENLALSPEAISSFDIPPFLLPIYQACGAEYRIPWEILASINRIETGFGRLNRVTSSAGAQGWMQFMPGTWDMYGTDANRDGQADPYNPVDAICSAARYLDAAGYSENVYQAIFAYNHADWYVRDVLAGAREYAMLPQELVSSISVLAAAPYMPGSGTDWKKEVRHDLSGVRVFSKNIRAVQDSYIEKRGYSKRWGNYLILSDVFGNRYFYSGLKRWTKKKEEKRTFLFPKTKEESLRDKRAMFSDGRKPEKTQERVVTKDAPGALAPDLLAGEKIAESRGDFFFSLRPAGKAPWLDPGVFLRGWEVLERASYGRLAKNSLSPAGALLLPESSLIQLVLKSKRISIPPCDYPYVRAGVLDRRVLATLLYLSARGYKLLVTSLHCGRESSITTSGNVSNHSRAAAVDIAAINGQVISTATQGPGSLTDKVAREVLAFQGPMAPDEVITLLDYTRYGFPAGFAMGDHDDHIHIGWSRDESEEVLRPNQWKDVIERLREIPSYG